MKAGPDNKRRGWLKNGNPPGDYMKAPRCGAKLRKREAFCRCPAMRNGRCRLHGGLSTGPKTSEGRERCRQAATTHGFYSQRAKLEQRRARMMVRKLRELLAGLRL